MPSILSGPDKRKVVQAEFNRIAPALEASVRGLKESRFEVVIPSLSITNLRRF